MAYSIYRQVQKQPDWYQSWLLIRRSFTDLKVWKLFLVLALMLVNWGIEAKKWQVLLKHVVAMPLFTAFKSVLSGVAFTMITPNRMGEFIGRVFYVDEGERLKAATLTIVGSVSQMMVTLLAGSVGLLVLRKHLIAMQDIASLSFLWVNGLLICAVLIFACITLFYFKLSWLARMAEKIKALQKVIYIISLLKEVHELELIRILILSMIRFAVFTSQYLLLFGLFGVEIPWWQGCCAISVLFLILAAIPLPGIAELGVRAKASVALFGLFSTNLFGIAACTGAIWLINIILPAVLGSLLILNVKLFNKNEPNE
jgi:hypothetical protein